MTELARAAATFAEVSALEPVGPGAFSADLHPEWTIAGRPNGGYLLAVLAGAAARTAGAARPAGGAGHAGGAGDAGHAGHPDVLAAGAHYLRSPVPGPVTVDVDVLRTGRTATQLRARMQQDGVVCVEALLTMASLGPPAAPFWDGGLPPAGDVAWDDASRLVPQTPDGSRVAILDQVEVRLDPASTGFTQGRPSGRGELRGWLALPGGEPFTPASLLFAVDAFPPATFDLEFSGWVPTLELTVYVRALPAAGPVRVLQQARIVADQRVDEACFVWDSTGRLVAQSTQLAAVRLG